MNNRKGATVNAKRLLITLGLTLCLYGTLVSPRNACAALFVGGDKQLFIDEQFFAQKSGIALKVNPLTNVQQVLAPDPNRPWEANRISAGNTVIDDNGQIKLYYDAIAPSGANDRSRWLCYAVSNDGVNFEKPNLGNISINGADTNIVLPTSPDIAFEPGNVFLDTNPNCPAAERYKMVGTFDRLTAMAYSADGRNWTSYNNPSFRLSDTTNVAYYDNNIGRYVGWVRSWEFGEYQGRRQVSRCEFDDVTNWGTETMVLSPIAEDSPNLDPAVFSGMDFYAGGVQLYQGAPNVYIGMPSAYYHYLPEVAQERSEWGLRNVNNDGPIEVQLVTSRDSLNWYRPEPGKAFIPCGPDGSCDDGETYVAGGSNLIYRGDEIWVYYTAAPFTHGDYATTENLALGSVMRGVMRLDGFVSADAGPEGGEFTTPEISFSGRHLDLNVDVADGGYLKVELLHPNGALIDGFSMLDCDPIVGDHIAGRVSWNGQSNLSSIMGETIIMRFQMADAKLYAFQFTTAPEPSSLAILGIAIAMLLLYRSTRIKMTKYRRNVTQ